MGVYIPKLTLPSVDSGGYHIKIDASGFAIVYAYNRVGECWLEELVTNAVEVKAPHGRLIDADALRARMYHEAFETDSDMQKWESGCWIRYKMFEQIEEAAPTVLEAEGNDG